MKKKWSLWAKPIIGAKLVEDRRQKNILGKKFYFSWFVTPGLTKLFKTLSGYSNRSWEQKWIHDLIRKVGLVHTLSMAFADLTTVTIPWGPYLTGLTLYTAHFYPMETMGLGITRVPVGKTWAIYGKGL